MNPPQKVQRRGWLIWLILLLILGMGIGVLNVSKPGRDVIACLEACATPSTSAETENFRILSLNMLHDYPDFAYLEERVALLSGEIGRLQPDIVLLQEVPRTDEHSLIAEKLAQTLGLNYVYLRANGNLSLINFEEGSAILSKYPLSDPRFTELRPPNSIFDNRIVLAATVNTPHGAIDLFVTHLTNGRPAINQAQAEALAAFVQAEAHHPAVVAGDFNAVESSFQIRQLANLWQDSYRLYHPTTPGATCCATDLVNAPTTALQTRIDYLFLAPTPEHALKVLEIEAVFTEPFAVPNGRLWLSDHAGLLATLTIEPQP